MLSSCFNFTSAYLSVYVYHDIVSLSVRHVVDVCCLIEGALTNREMVGERAAWGNVVKELGPSGVSRQQPPFCIPSLLPKCNRHIRVYLDGNVVSFNGLRKIHLYPRNFVIQIFYTSRDVFENSSLSERNHAMHIYVSLSPRT
jgi:hypothetical protein